MFQSTASSHTHTTIILLKYNTIHHTTDRHVSMLTTASTVSLTMLDNGSLVVPNGPIILKIIIHTWGTIYQNTKVI